MLSPANIHGLTAATLQVISLTSLAVARKKGAPGFIDEAIDGFDNGIDRALSFFPEQDRKELKEAARQEIRNLEENREDAMRLVDRILSNTIEVPCPCERCAAMRASLNR